MSNELVPLGLDVNFVGTENWILSNYLVPLEPNENCAERDGWVNKLLSIQ